MVSVFAWLLVSVMTDEKMGMNKREALWVTKTEGRCHACFREPTLQLLIPRCEAECIPRRHGHFRNMLFNHEHL